MRLKYGCLVALLLSLSALFPGAKVCNADHFPPEMIARARAEDRLCGVSVHGKIGAVLSRYGRPTKVVNSTSKNYPPGSGDREYVWTVGGTTLRVKTAYYTDAKTRKEVESETYVVSVAAKDHAERACTTASGLSLGDSIGRVKEVYGNRFFKYTMPTGLPRISFQWKDETMLTVYFDEQQKVQKMILEASVE